MNSAEKSVEMVNLSNILRSFRYWPRMFKLLWRTHPLYLSLILVLNIVKGLIPAVSLLATQHLINSVMYSQTAGSFQVVLWALSFFVIVGLFSSALGMILGYVDKLFETLVSNRINLMLMEKSVGLSLVDFEDAEVQDQLKRAQGESSYRPYMVFKQILAIIAGVVTLVSSAAILMAWKWWVAVLVMLIPLASFASFLRLGRDEFVIHYRRASKNREAWYLTYLLTRDQPFKEVKLYQLGNYLLQRYRAIVDGFYQEDKGLIRRRTAITAVFELVDQVAIVGMMLVVLWAAFMKEIMIGNVVSMIQAISLTKSVSQEIVGSILSLCQNNLYMEQLFAFLDLPATDVPASEDAADSDQEVESIAFRDVVFQYPGTDRNALQNVCFEVKQGEILAIVGRNGSGKTTLVKLLTQLYQDFKGDILLNGTSVRELEKEQLRRQIGVVFQDFVHYEMSARHNIGFGNLAAMDQDAKLMQAADQAGIQQLVQNFPKQLDTQLGRWFDEGHQLSGGQWQRIAIARAFMKDAGIYVLDEPSSFLDPQAEAEVFDKFRDLVSGRIGIFIFHRFSSVRYADKILVMDEGRVVEMGNHYELMQQGGLYRDLYETQVAAYLPEEPASLQSAAALAT